MSEAILKLKQQIKDWEHGFKVQHGRLPLKLDVNENLEIKALYSKYRSLKLNKHTVSDKAKSTNQDNETEKENALPTPSGELGPTPQANGRVLSIFDYKLTPPESSPLKNKSRNAPNTNHDLDSVVIDSTPVKARRRLSFSTPTKGSLEATPITITKKLQQAAETPRYLKSSTIHSFAGNAIDFLVSPSPLKPNRMGRKLMDVYNMSIKEVDDINAEEFIDVQEEEESEIPLSMNEPILKRKTQKRQTRRSKMAPRPTNETNSLDKVDVQQRIDKLDDKERAALAAYMNSESESESESEKDHTHGSPVKKTRKPIAQNYKRLKINDPRSRRFKQRMRR